MAFTFMVLVSRKLLPEVAELVRILCNANVPLDIEHPWSWKNDSGWLPMIWRDAASGCEVELGKLSKKDAAAAKRAGHSGFDVAVSITTRGWESLQCGVCFGAALAISASGCISETEDEYIGHDAALRWASESVVSADNQVQLDKERCAAKAEAQASGSIASRLEAALASLAGSEVKEFNSMFMSHLGVSLQDGRHISGSAWRVLGKDGTEHAKDRYPVIRTRQARHSSRADGAERKSELAALEEQLEQAAALDAQGASSALKEIETWPKVIKIQSADWTPPNIITVTLDAGTAIVFVGGLFGEITCSFPPLRYGITDEGPKLP